MAKIPIILEAGRADGKLIKTNNIYDDNQEKFLSDKIKEIDNNHSILKDNVNTLTEVVNNNESDIENKLETEKTRATDAENNLRETINNITEINENATSANIVTIDNIPNTSSSNVQQALNELFNIDEVLNNAIAAEQERAEAAEQANATTINATVTKNEEQDQKLSELERKITYDGDTQVVSMTDHVLNGYVDAISGEIFSWSSANYSIYKKQFTKDGIITLQRNVASVTNANIIAIMDDVSGLAVGVNILPYIVDNGTTTPLDMQIPIKKNQYLVVGYHVVESQRTTISFTETILINKKVEELSNEINGLSNEINGLSNEINGVKNQISLYGGDYQPASITNHVLNGYFDLGKNGKIEPWQNANYSIYKLQFANDAKIRLQRNVASVPNANIIAIVDDPSIVVVGAILSQYIVDDGTTTPLDKEVEISTGQWLIVGYHVVESQRTTISFTETIPINNAVKEIQQSVIKNTDNIAQNTNNIENGLFYHADGSVLRVTNMILERAFIDSNGSVESWSTSSYNIYTMQFQAPTDIRIVKTGSVYYSNEVLCKCHTLNGIVVGGQIDGEVVCIGTDYPFEEVVHFDAGEYLVRSGGVTEFSTFTIVEKKSLMPYARNLQGLRVDFEGDSVMEAKSTNGGWAALIQQMEGVIATNNGVSGTKIASILQGIKSRTPSDYDMIIVEGGFNDGSTPLGTFNRNDYRDEGSEDYDATTFYGAMEILCRYCLKVFPKAGVIVGYNWGNNTWNTTLANAMIEVCEKWGMPYVDLRTKAGFNLHTETLREKYGIYNGDVPVYNESKGYALDEKTKYEGKVYKANQVIASPAGVFNSSLWTYIGLEYDQCHCNLEGYKKSVGAIIQMMKSL